MICETNGRFVIGSGGSWLPGAYQTRSAARYAFQFSDQELHELNERVCRFDGENRSITDDDLKTYRRPRSAGERTLP
jgi:hypothetical protein